jgi:hypothetical protein
VASPRLASRISFASPKSSTLTRPSFVTMTLAGFKSRCTMPFSCAAASASPSALAISTICSTGSPPAGMRAVEWLALDQLHGQEVDAVGFLHRVDGDDVRVVELGEGLRFTAKARQPLRILRHPGGQHLKRYVTA